MARAKKHAEIVREYGPFEGRACVAGVTFDGKSVWFATGDALESVDPTSGERGRSFAMKADAGTTYDGEHLFQLAKGTIQKIDPHTGAVLATLPSPAGDGSSGLTWAEGTLWVAHHRARKLHQIDAVTGKLLRTIESTRFVTGVTFVDGELWHGTWENDESELRRIAPDTGEVLECLTMPEGTFVSGLEADGGDLFFCGGGNTAKVRAVKRPKRSA